MEIELDNGEGKGKWETAEDTASGTTEEKQAAAQI
jgi:hypothetical protein